MRGKIIKGIGGFYYVKTLESEILECKARGIFRKENIKPYIGDEVEISKENKNIEKILPRRTMLLRPPVANIDTVVIVISAKDPEPDTLFLDKLILRVLSAIIGHVSQTERSKIPVTTYMCLESKLLYLIFYINYHCL